MSDSSEAVNMRLHQMGYDHAMRMIECGKVSRGIWSFDSADEDKLLGPKGKHVEEFAKHHLGEDTASSEATRERFSYPCAKEGRVYMRALKAIRSKALENNHADVYSAAGRLMDSIELGGADESMEQNDAPPAPERRFVKGIELRSAPEGSAAPGTVVGYASVCSRMSEDLGYFREMVAPNAFSQVMKDDVRALVNHNPDRLIGRSTAGTLRMTEDAVGLRVEIDLPDTTDGRDTAVSIRRGDLTGMSFSFDTASDSWDYQSDPPTRTLLKVARLYDVGPVAFPAYADTTAAMRSLRADQTRSRPPVVVCPSKSPNTSLARAKARQRMAAAQFPV